VAGVIAPRMVARTKREMQQHRTFIHNAQAEAEPPRRCRDVDLETVGEVGADARFALAGSRLLEGDSIAFAA